MIELRSLKPPGNREVVHVIEESFEQCVKTVKSSIHMGVEGVEEGQDNGEV